MWSCATTDTAHAQRSYLTDTRLTFAFLTYNLMVGGKKTEWWMKVIYFIWPESLRKGS